MTLFVSPILAAILAAFVTLLAVTSEAVVAKVENYHGSPAIMVNGKPLPPMSITAFDVGGHSKYGADTGGKSVYFRKLGEAGIRLFYVKANTNWLQPGNQGKGVPSGVEDAVKEIRFVLDAVPDAWIMLRLTVSPPRDWVNAHPEEQVTYSDGSHRKVICTSVSRKEPIDGMYSLCSEAWRKEGDKAIEDFFQELAKHPECNRVIGAFLCSGGSSEWYYPDYLATSDGAYGDFSEPFRKEYERYLRGKYRTVEELRRVWRQPDATFERPTIPKLAERGHIGDADEKIKKALQNWENADRELNCQIDLHARSEVNVGVFLNVNGHAHVADFWAAWHEGTARTIIHFAKTLKRIRPNLLVGAFYGSMGQTTLYDGGTATGTLTILDSGVVDFLAAPGTYNNREPGGIVAQREMQDSFRIRNMIFIAEDDSRTHLCKPWMQRDAMALYTVKDSIDTLKRDFARDICEDIHSWWFDMGCGWYDDPDILALFTRQQEIAAEAYELDRTKKNEIALVYDTESIHHVSAPTSALAVDYWRTSDLGRIGAPVDYYFHNDLADPRMPDYKLYVMVNTYHLADAERDAVYAKARKNGATVLWMYAAGFFNLDATKVMDPANVSKTIGMNVGFYDRTLFPHFRVDPASHPMLAGASPTRRYGLIDRDVHSSVWLGNLWISGYLNPGFYVDDPKATVLGRYCSDGKPALAMIGTNGVKSVYCATAVMRSDLLASIAHYAGCHIYTGDDVLYANENYVVIHASTDGRKTIRFKKKCSPYEVYEKRYYGHDVNAIKIDMRLGDTRMWQLR